MSPASAAGPSSAAASGRSQTVDEMLAGSDRREVRRLPVLVRQAFALVWKAAPRQLLLSAKLQIVAGLSLAAQLLVMRRVLVRITATEGLPDLRAMTPELVIFGSLVVVVGVAAVAHREQQRILAEYVGSYTTQQVMEISTSVELIEFDRPAFYDRLERARINASVRPLQIAQGVLGLIGSATAVVAVGAALLTVEPLVAVVVGIGALPSVFLNRLSSRAFHKFSVEQVPGDRRRMYLYQTLSQKVEAQEIRAFGSGDHLRSEYRRLYEGRIAATRALARRRLLYGTGSTLVAACVTVGALIMIVSFIRSGRIGLGDAAVAVGALFILAGRLRGLIGSTGTLYEGSLFLQDFTDFLTIGRALSRGKEFGGPAPTFERLELDGVSFTYPSRNEPSLRDVSLSIRDGEVIALVGENGSGKTTLTKILAGLYQPSRGTMYLDGHDAATLDPAALRAQVTVIFQDFSRYFLTAHENIAISRISDVDDEVGVRRAAALAGADAFLSTLPAGYRTLLGPSFFGGSDLSLGQWQRVALARAYFRDAPMLILDEPTASLDPRGEYEVFQQVRALAEGHTVVLVSHRFSSVRAADRILVLDDGRLIEEGSHEELLERGGLYHELFTMQAKGYEATAT
jgi:ATP-binding cassette, subfamily B, bacterial